jgi:hypothetical protein
VRGQRRREREVERELTLIEECDDPGGHLPDILRGLGAVRYEILEVGGTEPPGVGELDLDGFQLGHSICSEADAQLTTSVAVDEMGHVRLGSLGVFGPLDWVELGRERILVQRVQNEVLPLHHHEHGMVRAESVQAGGLLAGVIGISSDRDLQGVDLGHCRHAWIVLPELDGESLAHVVQIRK